MREGDFTRTSDYPPIYVLKVLVAVVRFMFSAIQGVERLAQAPTADFYVWGRA